MAKLKRSVTPWEESSCDVAVGNRLEALAAPAKSYRIVHNVLLGQAAASMPWKYQTTRIETFWLSSKMGFANTGEMDTPTRRVRA